MVMSTRSTAHLAPRICPQEGKTAMNRRLRTALTVTAAIGAGLADDRVPGR
jgi:hypothetical protein